MSANGKELAVGIDVVVFLFIGGERSGVFHLVGGAGSSRLKASSLGSGVGVDGVQKQFFAGSEVLIERKGAVEGNNGGQVGRLHLLVDVVARGILGPLQVLGLHGRDVEEHHDQAVVVQLVRGGDAVHVAQDAVGRLAVDGGLVERRSLIDALEVEAGDLLRLAIFLER